VARLRNAARAILARLVFTNEKAWALYHYKIDKQGNARNITSAAENVFCDGFNDKSSPGPK